MAHISEHRETDLSDPKYRALVQRYQHCICMKAVLHVPLICGAHRSSVYREAADAFAAVA